MTRGRKPSAKKPISDKAVGKRKALTSAIDPIPESTSSDTAALAATSTKSTSTQRGRAAPVANSTTDSDSLQSQLADRDRALADALRQIEELRGE